MLPSPEVTAMAAAAATALPDLATITYQNNTPDPGTKHITPGSLPRTSNVPCRLAGAPARAFRPDAADRLYIRQPWVITLPAGTLVAIRDVIQIGGRSFEVLDVANGSWEITRRVFAKELVAGG